MPDWFKSVSPLIAYLALIVSVISLGWQVYIWRRDRKHSLALFQRGSEFTNRVFSLQGGLTAFVIHVALINKSPTTSLVIRGFDLELLWKDEDFDWLFDPKEMVPNSNSYSFPTTELNYPREEVLNHQKYSYGKLRPGDVIEGILLGLGQAPIPEDIRHGEFREMKLSVIDQFGKWHSIQVELRFDKSRFGIA